jgi:hypothetical protein
MDRALATGVNKECSLTGAPLGSIRLEDLI